MVALPRQEGGGMMTRQRRWQLKKVAAGMCGRCGEPRGQFPFRCDSCQLAHRLYRRELWHKAVAEGRCGVCYRLLNRYKSRCDRCVARRAQHGKTRG